MSLISLDLPLENLPNLHDRDGQVVQGYIRGGKLYVTISLEDEADTVPCAAKAFVRKWSGQGKLLASNEMADDPRLAELTAKHIH